MTDVLLELSKNSFARKLVASAGLPIPMPQALARPKGPSVERFLEDKQVRVAGDGALAEVLAAVLPRAGAATLVTTPTLMQTIAGTAEAYGRVVRQITPTDAEGETKAHALIID